MAVMSDTHLDLHEAQLSAGVTEICVKATFAAVRITVPPHVHVVTETTPILASVSHRSRSEGGVLRAGAPVVYRRMGADVRRVGAHARAGCVNLIRRVGEWAGRRVDDHGVRHCPSYPPTSINGKVPQSRPACRERPERA